MEFQFNINRLIQQEISIFNENLPSVTNDRLAVRNRLRIAEFFQTCLRHKMAIDGGDSCRGGIIDKIRLGLYKYFRFSETKNQNTLNSLGFNK